MLSDKNPQHLEQIRISQRPFQGFGIPDPLFEHLGRCFHKIELGGDPGEADPLPVARKEVVQQMAELMEEGFHLRVFHQGAFVVFAGKVADER